MQTQRIVLTIFMIPVLAALQGCEPGDRQQDGKAAVAPPPPAQQTADQSGSAVVSREEFTKLAKDIGCFACHSIEKKLLGPAWKDVAAIYRHDPTAEDKMMQKIAKGGSGVWGTIDMPAYPDLGEAKTRTLVKFILSLDQKG